MKRFGVVVLGLVLLAGCGKKEKPPEDPNAVWSSTPAKVVEGIMHAYSTRDDRLYASLLAEDFRYYFKPQGPDSTDILGWGKDEEVVATGNLFKTPDVEKLSYTLNAGTPRAGSQDGWMVVPVAGGVMVVSVKGKEPMTVNLNRQEIVVRKTATDPPRWEIMEWHDFPAPVPPEPPKPAGS